MPFHIQRQHNQTLRSMLLATLIGQLSQNLGECDNVCVYIHKHNDQQV